MATINLRQLGDGVVERLKQRAARNNRSLGDEVRHILECSAADDMVANRTAFLTASINCWENPMAASKHRRKS